MSYKSEREIISTTDKLSAVAARLEPNTKYQFHVHAINGVNTEGQFGPSAKSKTKFRMFARQLLKLQDLMQ